MAKARKRAGKRATAAGRNKPRARKSGAPKAAGTASRKPKSAKSKVAEATTRKQEPSPGSEAASLRQQLKAARLQQDAIAEILQVISNSPGELGPVFRMVLENATRLCDAKFGTVHRFDGKAFYFAADVGAPQALAEYMRRPGPVQSPKGGMLDRIKTTRQMQHTPDYAADRVPGLGAKLGGARSTLGVPILRDDVLVGALVIYRQEVRPFSDREIDLVRSFAAQAAIAIENARLFNEVRKRTNDLTEALQQQTATAEVLQTISRSSFDVDAILRMLVKTAARLCNAGPAQIFRRDGDVYRYAASQILEPAYREHEQHIEIRPGRGTLVGRVALEKRPVQILDAWDDPEYEEKDAARIGNVRSMLAVPLLRDGESIGAFAMARDYVEPFTESQVKLVSTFADQAVIAIENARLFNETQEALERQTATSDILKVIASSPDNVQPVFEAIASSARRLIGGFSTAVHLVVDDMVHLVAFTPTNPEADAILVAAHPRHRSEVGAVALVENGEIAQIADSETADAHTRQLGRARGWRGLTLTPLMNHGNFIGFIASTRRETGVLGNHHVELLRTFADQAVIAIENARLFNETREALERQTATSDILATINGSGGFLAPVFECILEKAHQLCGAPCGSLQLYQDGRVQPVAIRGMTPAFSEFLQAGYPITEGVRAGLFADHPVQRVDMVETLREQPDEPSLRAAVELGGIRTMASVPLLKDGVAFGRIIAARQEVRPFDDKQLATLQGFAAQAVIAIENARLLNELRARTDDLGESLQQQTATADVLKVISRSAFDLDSVMNTLAHSAGELCKAKISALYLREGDVLIARGVAEADAAQAEFLRRTPLEANSSTYLGRTLLAGAVRNIANVSNETEIGLLKKFSEVLDFKSILFVPLMREGRGVGVFALARKRTGLFSQREVDLVQTFADQAVIAIENARLFEEVQAKTRDLTESLQQQTAVGEVLGTISRSTFELQPVLDTLVKAAAHLCDAEMAFIMRREGEIYRAGASVGFSDEYAKFLKAHPITPNRGSITGRAVLDRRTVQIVDVASDPEYTLSESTTLAGQRTALGVPLLRENEPIGVIVIARRRVQEFTARQIELVSTFADQAVIAMENVRLFNETQEALERQTATADILKVIASSPSDVQPVFEAIATRANSLVGGFSATVFRFIGGMAHLMAFTPTTPEADEVLKSTFPSPLDNFAPFQMARDGEVAQVPDTEALTDEILDISRARGFRSMVFAPLMNKGTSIGLIAVTRTQTGAFSDHHVQLLRTFADQAVIAIENVRLFDEVQAKTRDLEEALQQQTATADVLKVISRSAFDLQTVLETLIKSAVELSGTNRGSIFLREGDVFPLKAASSTTPEFLAYWAANPPRAGRGSATSRVIASGKVEIIPDVLEDPDMEMSVSSLTRIRAALGVPMLRDSMVEGVLVLTRPEPGPFTKSQIELVQTFADQATIAIENARLFNEVQARTKELSLSLDELRAAQDRLVQTEKLASLGQLTAGIAHEIKNPLNFVNNFSALSAELTDELKDLLHPVVLDEATRAEVKELTGLLKDNLEKVVQHGKRADSIVKNMLLHSREGSGERRPSDINALVEESLNLAYHGARAEKSGFNIALKRDLDPAAGTIELYPQEITRVLLNLISNGFYAASKRNETGENGFEPTLSAATKDLGKSVEIRIRDNGTGIPAEVREKMFNPFFTTKPAGEGTGLGLSMSYDIVVKQHGGSIDVETRPGAFTEFIITLPRELAARRNPGGAN